MLLGSKSEAAVLTLVSDAAASHPLGWIVFGGGPRRVQGALPSRPPWPER